jgi:hypothetical protein
VLVDSRLGLPRVLLCEAWHEASEIADTSA